MPYGLLDDEEKKLQYGIPTISGESVLPQKIEKNEVRIQPAEKSDSELSNEFIKQKYFADKAELEAAKDESRQRRMGVGILDAISSGLQTVTGAKAPNYANAYAGAAEPVEDVRESQKNWKSNPNDPRNLAYRQMLQKNPDLANQLESGGVDVKNFTLGGYEDFSPISKELFGIQKSKNEFGQKVQLAGLQNKSDIEKEKIKAGLDAEKAAIAKGPAYQGELAPLNQLPPSSRENAVKEMNDLKKFKEAETDVQAALEEAIKFNVAEAVAPSYLGGKSELYDATMGKISAAIIDKVPGIRSDADFVRIVKPLLPKSTETGDVAKQKVAGFIQWLKAQRPSASLLKSVGARALTDKEEKGIDRVMKKNNISREEAIKALEAAGKL